MNTSSEIEELLTFAAPVVFRSFQLKHDGFIMQGEGGYENPYGRGWSANRLPSIDATMEVSPINYLDPSHLDASPNAFNNIAREAMANRTIQRFGESITRGSAEVVLIPKRTFLRILELARATAGSRERQVEIEHQVRERTESLLKSSRLVLEKDRLRLEERKKDMERRIAEEVEIRLEQRREKYLSIGTKNPRPLDLSVEDTTFKTLPSTNEKVCSKVEPVEIDFKEDDDSNPHPWEYPF